MAEALLSGSVQFVVEKIASQEFRRFIKNRKLNQSFLDKLETTLLSLDAVLVDAEEQQITNKKVKEWLDELKDAVLDAEDLLDRISTDDLRRKVEAQYTNQVQQFIASINFNPWKMNSKIEALLQRLELFAQQKETLGLKKSLGRGVSHRTPTSSVVNEFAEMIGRDGDKEKLMNFLLSDDPNNNHIGVITIKGLGGVGKTTLAQLLFNDQRVKNHFDLRAWACVSDVFDVALVTKTLLESATSQSRETWNLELLQNELKQTLNNKKYLIVLDDLWNDKYNEWDELRTPFCSGKQGSRIIITTRQGEVARMTHTFPVHNLEPLSHDDCWSILAQHAFENRDPSRYPNLEVVGKKIAEKCGGLPIAAKTLGGVLRSKVDENEWNNVLNSNLWELPNDEVLPALWLSYLYLPSHLKRCFAYCSIFPKDYPLDRKCIVFLWMAEGLLQERRNKSMERLGIEYFGELMSRSLIQQVGGDFVMHDLVNDLATVVSGKSCSRLESVEIDKNLRHLSYLRGRYDSCIKFQNCFGLKHLRAFLPLSLLNFRTRSCLTGRVTEEFLPTQKSLRVLSLAEYYNVRDLPNSIGNLIHLRYLDLSYTSVERLSDTIFKLYNLQALRLVGCENLVELPADIEKLVNLRHLDMSGTRLKKMSRQITRLENLKTLSTFVIGKHDEGLCVSDLRHFPELEGKLEILKLGNVAEARDALEANLKNRELIEELELEWGSEWSQGSEIEAEVLELLQPSTNLRKLRIHSYNGTGFPQWLGDFSFSNVVSLSISDCKFCLNLPPLGQLPSLKELEVESMDSVKTVGEEFYGYGSGSTSFQPFPSLERLSFWRMANWEEWVPFSMDGIEYPFPCLRELVLFDCPKLRGHLPHHLPSSLTRVQMHYCDELEGTAFRWITSIEDLEIHKVGPGLLLPIIGNDCPTILSILSIGRCDGLPCLPRTITSNNCLTFLSLYKISSLTSFPTEGIPTLRRLEIQQCNNLELPMDEACRNYLSLEHLWIVRCDSLTSFPLGCFPVLKSLELIYCDNLKSLRMSQVASALSLSSLESLYIADCPNMESFPQGGLCTTNLIHFEVSGCHKLGSLPERMDTLKLQSFSVFHCKGLPPTAIVECIEKLRPSLLECRFEGDDDVIKALLKHGVLPSSLVSLQISCFDNVKFLDGNGLKHVTSLKVLHIADSPRLQYLPKDSLPSSLSRLVINGCPLLRARYYDRKGKHRPKIARVPVIDIDGEVMI